MKKISIVLVLISFLYACQNSETDNSTLNKGETITSENIQIDSTGPVIKFDKSVYDFGEVTDGDSVKYSYTFTNVGNKSLKIANAVASCGCTVPDYPKDSIKPGEKGAINIVFNSKNRVGAVDKTVTIMSNTQPTETQVKLIGKVVEKK